MLPIDLSLRRMILENIKEISPAELDQYELLVAARFFLEQFSKGDYLNKKKISELNNEIDLIFKKKTEDIKGKRKQIQAIQNFSITRREESLNKGFKKLNPGRIFKTPKKVKSVPNEFPKLDNEKIKSGTRLKNFLQRNY